MLQIFDVVADNLQNNSRYSTGSAVRRDSSSLGRSSYDSSMSSYTMPDGTVLQNPFTLNENELEALNKYLSGTVFLFGIGKREAEAAYAKYQQYIQWYDQQQSNSWETDYNSEASQVERMEEAGLNADLLGVGSSTADTASGGYTLAPPSSSAPFEDFGTLIGSFADIAGLAFNGASGIVGLVKSFEDIRGLSLENMDTVLNNGVPRLLDMLGENALSAPENFFGSLGSFDYDSLGYDKQSTKTLRTYFDNLLTLPTEQKARIFGNLKKFAENRAGFNNIIYNGVSGYDVTPIYKDFMKMQTDYTIAKQNYDNTLLRWQTDYQNYMNTNGSAEQAAEADLGGYASKSFEMQAKKFNAQLQLQMKGILLKLGDSLVKFTESGDPVRLGIAAIMQDKMIRGFNSEYDMLTPFLAPFWNWVSGESTRDDFNKVAPWRKFLFGDDGKFF